MRDYLKIYVPAALLIIAGFALAWRFVNPAPPRTIRMAGGPEQGAYIESARRYSEILARDGITLEVQVTSGSLQNLQLLRAGDGGVDVAFVQGGTVSGDTSGLMSLASVFFEPLWVFVRGETPFDHLAHLKGRRLAVGVEGSGTRALALQLLAAAGLANDVTLRPLGGDEAVQALLAGTVDAAFFVTARPLPQLEPLLHAKGIRLMSFAQADALAQRFRFLSKVVLPEGRLDLAANIPSKDVVLVAPAAALVARKGLHPAIIDQIIQAATEVNGRAQLFSEPGQFPSVRFLDIPVSPDAARYLKSGPTFLRRHLPFWAAAMVERFLVLLIPIVTLLFPLLRFGPPAYRWQVRRRITRRYRKLRQIDALALESKSAADRARALEQLQALEEEVESLKIPPAYADSLYLLWTHIRFIRRSIEDGPEAKDLPTQR
ncbi:MAG TPA: TAXI family TRAP transporter solute-binding subunit [Candidatus Sulfotelmatobacter sp.]|nr:TAXI family TRAP transporter solute-binding subunit [Candidatus Sulfotelmatobacter sp.]